MNMPINYILKCVECSKHYKPQEIRYRCVCGEVLEVKRSDLRTLKKQVSRELFDTRLGSRVFPYTSGVWRYKELLSPIEDEYIISKPEGNTHLYSVGIETKSGLNRIGKYAGVVKLYLKHEGENPTGSFKDRGMTVGVSVAKSLRQNAVACASTGNTSASLAAYAAQANMPCFVFIPKGKISLNKLAQTIAYGATVIQINGDFDSAMQLVEKICNEYSIYLLNSINPFRIEGQKSILFELLHQLNWQIPDWIVLPAGNLGNTSAIGKALLELNEIGFIKKLPRIAAIQAAGANPFYQSFRKNFHKRYSVKANTVANAIQIGNPVSYQRAKKVIEKFDGVVEEVSDQEILDAKAIIDTSGIGCEPASAATIAGIKKLGRKKIIASTQFIAGILTGHILKDTDTTIQYHENRLNGIVSHFHNQIVTADSNVSTIKKILLRVLAQRETV